MSTAIRTTVCASVFALLAVGAALAEPITPLPGHNVALGKKATFSWAPNQRDVTAGDETDLTDGKFFTDSSKYSFWTDPGCVGWAIVHPPGVMITIDLEKSCTIDTVAFDTASCIAVGVAIPAAVMVYVSDDGKNWRYATNIINESVPQDKYVRHRFVAKGLKNIRGRFVGLYIVKGGFYAFVDEVEVLSGKSDPASITPTGKTVATDKIEADSLARAKASVQNNISLAFIQAARNQKPNTATLAVLDHLQAEVAGVIEVDKVDYTAGLPYSRIDREVCKAMGTFYRAESTSPLTLWLPEPPLWSHTTSPFARPASKKTVRLHADMMVGELEPVAFNVSNNTAEPMEVHVSVANLGTWSAASVEKRVTTHVTASGFLFFDDALTPFDDKPVTIPAGMTRQVWLILNSRGIAAGDYQTMVTVEASGNKSTIPLTATVYPVEMPARPKYRSQTFVDLTSLPGRGFEKQAAAELDRAYETAQYLMAASVPWPEVDPQTKKLVRPIKLGFEKLDEMLALRPYVRQWLLWPQFDTYESLNFHGATDMPAIGTPEYNDVFKEWVRQIRDHLKEKGYTTDDWAFFWVDEPAAADFVKHVVPASKLAKEVDPTILIWEDHHTSEKTIEEHPNAVDIHCCTPEHYRANPKLLARAVAGKHPSAQYECASSKNKDPHRYYRLHQLASVR